MSPNWGPAQFMCPLQKGVILAACLPSLRTNTAKTRGLHKKWRLINSVNTRCEKVFNPSAVGPVLYRKEVCTSKGEDQCEMPKALFGSWYKWFFKISTLTAF